MAELSQEQIGPMIDALVDGFDYDGLRLLLYRRFRIRIETITLAGNYQTVVQDVVERADREYWARELAVAAADANPRHPVVRAVADSFLVTPHGVERVELEAILSKYDPFFDPTIWRLDMAEQEPRVCKITGTKNNGHGFSGTGFLVGPDRVMTAGHVVAEIDPNTVKLIFDHRVLKKEEKALPGVEYRLRLPEWRLAYSAEGKLDFAVLAIDGTPGNDPIGAKTGEPNAPKRGWMPVGNVDPMVYATDRPVLILQHPLGEPLKLAWKWGSVVEKTQTLLRHRTSTQPGSSGSPVFDDKWNVIAVHHGTEGQSNQSIPIEPVLAEAAEQKVTFRE